VNGSNLDIKRIIMTLDFLRDPDLKLCNSKLQGNLKVFSTLFGDLFKEITDVPMELNFENMEDLKNLIYDRNGYAAPYSKKYWSQIFYEDKINLEIQNQINNIFGGALVVGIELPYILRNYFDTLEIPYVDIIIHPIRYMDDLALGIRTNNESIYKKLMTYQVSVDQFKLNATYLKIASRTRTKDNIIEPDSCVIFGQTDEDISILREDKVFANILDYKDKIEGYCKKYNHVYFKPHPYGPDSKKIIECFERFDNFSLLTDVNAYDLYSSENVSLCVGLSSGSLYEAKFFGKDIEYLFRQPFQYGEDYVDRPMAQYNFKDVFVTIYKDFLTFTFWADIFSELLPTKTMDNIEINIPNIFRYASQGIWSFNDNKSIYVERQFANILTKKTKKKFFRRLKDKIKSLLRG